MLGKALQGAALATIPQYIEDVFSTYVYPGTSAPQTMANGVDVSGNGGLVWLKYRAGTPASGYDKHILFDTARGNTVVLSTNNTNANEGGWGDLYFRFKNNGFDTGTGTGTNQDYLNKSGVTYTSWTFRKQAKFFDVVTYTGNGTSPRTISHSLGSVPGCVVIKSSSGTGNWVVRHRGVGGSDMTVYGSGDQLYMNSTAAASGTTDIKADATTITLGSATEKNAVGVTYVAYLFAHDAGGFGLTGTDNVISCGSFNYTAFPQSVSLGYEPQWLIAKRSDGVGDWIMFDSMRGFTANGSGGRGKYLLSNSSAAEVAGDNLYYGSATSFALNLPAFGNYIYIAIRRGPMRTPTSGTSVFSPVLWTGNSSASRVITTTNMPVPDAGFLLRRSSVGSYFTSGVYDRLRWTPVLATNSTQNESYWGGTAMDLGGFGQGAVTLPSNAAQWNDSPTTFVGEFFSRAPGFFDVVCYTGTGVARTVNHNLGVSPEIVLVKRRDSAGGWFMYTASTGATNYLRVDDTLASTAFNLWNDTAPTSSVFSLSTNANVNANGGTYVAYLFATLTGVSKVGSYTGDGSTKTINCGFTTGARFILIKRTDNTGNWYVWDTARGIVSGNDPYLLLNTTAVENSNDTIDPDNSGFIVNQVAATNVNVTSATYIYLAIA